jgi:membrane peptidoglycan carboxypeptidase
MSTSTAVAESPQDELSLPQAAQLIGMSRSTAYLEVVRGNLRARLVAGRYAVVRRDALEYRRARDTQSLNAVASA